MSDFDIEVSVVIPCYNERENLRPLCAGLGKALGPRGISFELVVIDDASTDGSWEVLKGLGEELPFLRAQRFRRNCGQSAALEAGVRASRGRTIVTLDGDFQNDPGDLGKLLDALGDCDCASGDRTASRREGYGLLRVVSSRIANWVRNKASGESFADSACNFRAARRECFERIRFFNGAHRFITTLIKMEGFKVKEVPISSRPRLHGKSKYGVWNRLFRAARDLSGVRWMKSRHIRYEVSERMGRE